ncbi:hypothetical protein RchiOBHm_Chr2g0136231 [Rosa chinensis]|uniref:Uncharacterized protein n=1 Tax=Rosa chinensis TaxID=74649 RepID=A0A2P6RWA5_ROSCH|nr:hypothetical protein RchiOBHm_Chr2g0136231 [Rosa chinensis]
MQKMKDHHLYSQKQEGKLVEKFVQNSCREAENRVLEATLFSSVFRRCFEELSSGIMKKSLAIFEDHMFYCNYKQIFGPE